MIVQDSQIIAASEQARQAAEAARLLGMSMNQYKRRAIKLGCYKTNQGLKGVQKPKERVYTVNDNQFEFISLKNAYQIGYLAADGTVVGNSLRVNINARDIGVLKHLLEVMDSNNPILKYKQHYKDEDGIKHEFDALSIKISQKKIVQDLAKFGIVQRKQTLDIDFTKNIPDEFKMPFIIGLFDGDGHAYFNEKYKSREIGIAQNYSTIQQINEIFLSLGMKTHITDKGTFYILQLSDKGQITIFHQIYSTYAKRNFVLQRKLNTIKKMLGI